MKPDDVIIVKHWKEVLQDYIDPILLIENLPTVFEFGKAEYSKVNENRNEERVAVGIAIDAIIKSEILFDDLIEAIKKAGSEWLARLISGDVGDHDVAEESERTNHLEQIRKFLTSVAPHIKSKIDAREVAEELKIKDVIKPEECERVNCRYREEGNSRAAIKLLSLLVRKTDEWLVEFIEVMENQNYDDELIQSLKGIASSQTRTAFNSGALTEMQTFGEKEPVDVQALPSVTHPRIARNAANFASPIARTDGSATVKLRTVTPNSSSHLREYQVHLSSSGVAGDNVIICAPTGCGKTRVAAHIIHTRFKDMLNDNPKIAFLVPRVGLAKQQADSIKSFMNSNNWKVDYLVGDSKTTLKECLRIYHVIVMTPQILLNALNEKSITVGIFNMIIFDECHHTVSESPYNNIMFHYHTLKESKGDRLPQIIGLTATLGVGKGKSSESAMDHILWICASLDASGGIVTVPRKYWDDLYQYTASPEEENIELGKISDPFTKCLCETIDELLEHLQQLDDVAQVKERIPQGLPKGDQQYLQWCGSFSQKALDLSTTNPVLCRNVQACIEYLTEYNKALDLYLKCRGIDSLKYLEENHSRRESTTASMTEQRLFEISKVAMSKLRHCLDDPRCKNTNLEIIAAKIKETFSGDSNSRVMFNVKKRQYARPISDWLNENKGFIDLQLKAEFFTGVGKGADGKSKGLTHSGQERILENFRSGQIKILVCTPEVASEGLDIVDCNLVICYDYTKNEISKTQVKGRARKQGGKMIQFSSREVLTRDQVNEAKTLLMDETTEKVRSMFTEEKENYLHAIKSRQKQRAEDIAIRRMYGNNAPEHPPSKLFLVTCRKCSNDVCMGEHIVKINNNHTCISKDFSEKYYEKEVHDGGTERKTGLFCKSCHSKWGIFARYKKIYIAQLDPGALTFVDRSSPDRSIIAAKWAKVKIKFEDIDYYESMTRI